LRILLSQSSSSYASFEDVSTSGTVVLRGQHDDSDSPQTPRSRLGPNSRNLNTSFEDSATNLAEVLLFFFVYALNFTSMLMVARQSVFYFAVCRVFF